MRTTIGTKYWISSVKITKGIYETMVFPLINPRDIGFNKTLVDIDYNNDLDSCISHSWIGMYKNHKKLVNKYNSYLPHFALLNSFWS